MATRAFLKAGHGTPPHRKPTLSFVRFLTDGATDPTEIAGIAVSVQRLIQAATIPFWRVTAKYVIDHDSNNTTYCPAVTLTAATVGLDVVASVVKGGLTGDVGGAITKPAEQFDVVMKTGTTPVDTAGVYIDVQIHYDGV